MAIERVREYLKRFGVADRILEFEVSSATVALAALALGGGHAPIANRIYFVQPVGGLVFVGAGYAKVDNAKFKAQFGMKAKMLTPEEAQRLVGHAVGGVCPFAVNAGVPVFLDASLKRFETVFPACGSASSAIEMTLAELEQFSCAAAWVDVCKGWQAE